VIFLLPEQAAVATIPSEPGSALVVLTTPGRPVLVGSPEIPSADRPSFRTLAPVSPPLAQSTAPSRVPTLGSAASPALSTVGASQASQGEDDGEPPSPRPSPPGSIREAPLAADEDDPAQRGADLDLAPELGESLGWLAGGGIALLTLVIPIGSVLLDRGPALRLGSSGSSATLPGSFLPGTSNPPPQGPGAPGSRDVTALRVLPASDPVPLVR
jgi:hypothetical protein